MTLIFVVWTYPNEEDSATTINKSLKTQQQLTVNFSIKPITSPFEFEEIIILNFQCSEETTTLSRANQIKHDS